MCPHECLELVLFTISIYTGPCFSNLSCREMCGQCIQDATLGTSRRRHLSSLAMPGAPPIEGVRLTEETIGRVKRRG